MTKCNYRLITDKLERHSYTSYVGYPKGGVNFYPIYASEYCTLYRMYYNSVNKPCAQYHSAFESLFESNVIPGKYTPHVNFLKFPSEGVKAVKFPFTVTSVVESSHFLLFITKFLTMKSN